LPVITGVGHRAGLDAVTVRPAAGLTADEITEQLGASRAALRHGLQVMTEALIGRGARERLLVDGAGSTDTSPTIAWLLTELGIITAGDATPAMGCPDGASDPAGTPMQVEGERWSCACCGATGDVFDLYVRVAGLAPERAVSLRESWPTLRRARPAPEGAIVVDPQRIQQLQQHRAATW
jgi:hypothetical protein